MAVPPQGVDMTKHQQYLVVRNERGREMLASVQHRLQTTPPESQGNRRPIVLQVRSSSVCPSSPHQLSSQRAWGAGGGRWPLSSTACRQRRLN